MKFVLLLFSILPVFSMTQNIDAQTPKEFAEVWEKTHITNKFPSNVRHKHVKTYLQKLAKLGLKVDEVGKSYGDREIYRVKWGKGETKIFMWSQMHGDEPTATSALFDMFAFLQTNRSKKKWVKKLEKSISIHAIPMLNPDGSELFQRRNLQSIDINRDAQALETPEGRLLKKLRDEWKPDFGFNLHNQQELTTVGKTFEQATISLLAVSGREDGKTYDGHERNKRICAVMINSLNQFIKGKIGRYDDSYNPRAFGDMISAWGTPVILVETGGSHENDEMFLIKLNFIAYLSALQSIVDGTMDKADGNIYENLPFNSGGKLFNHIFRNANVINTNETNEPFTADIAINRERRREEITAPTFVREIGDLKIYKGLEEYDVSDYYLVPKNGLLQVGSRGEFYFYKKTRNINWTKDELLKIHPPDSIFANGQWTKGGENFTR